MTYLFWHLTQVKTTKNWRDEDDYDSADVSSDDSY